MAVDQRWKARGGVQSGGLAHGSKHRCALVGRFCGEKNLELLEALISSRSSPQTSSIHSDDVKRNLIPPDSLVPQRLGDEEPYLPRHGARSYYYKWPLKLKWMLVFIHDLRKSMLSSAAKPPVHHARHDCT